MRFYFKWPKNASAAGTSIHQIVDFGRIKEQNNTNKKRAMVARSAKWVPHGAGKAQVWSSARGSLLLCTTKEPNTTKEKHYFVQM